MPASADPAVLPTSPTQDGTIQTPSDPARSILAGAGEAAPSGTLNPGTVDENTDAALTAAELATKAAADAEAAAAAAAALEPLTWDKIAVPEGLEVPEELQSQLLTIFNNRELSPAEVAAQALALHASQAQAMWDEGQKLWEKTQQEWAQQVRDLPEFAGGRYEQELGRVAKLLNKFGGSEVRKALDLTGAGNNPDVVRFFYKLAKEVIEDEPATGQVLVQSTATREERMYGNKTGG